jgi:hypothetical protein
MRATRFREGGNYQVRHGRVILCHSRGDVIRLGRISAVCFSRGEPFPQVFVIEATEDRTGRNPGILGGKVSAVGLREEEHPNGLRNSRSKA